MSREIILFFHIEKCGGTSLVEFFRRNLPFRACEAVSKTNVFSEEELATTLKVYPRLKVLSGHNLTIDAINWLEDRNFEVDSFTILRNPLERTISDFLHDYRKGTFTGSLIDYANISWKQNYLGKFLGSGDPAKAYRNLERIGSIIEIKQSMQFINQLSQAHGLVPRIPYAIENKAASGLPEDVTVRDGAKVGRYSISQEAHTRLLHVNGLDLDLWKYAQSRLVQPVSEDIVRTKYPRRNSTGWKKLAASLQRNLAYKPMIGIRSKYYALPRNRANPQAVAEETAFQ